MKLYRIEYEGGHSHVEADDFAAAISIWRKWVLATFGEGEDSGWNDASQPDSVHLLDDNGVLR